MKRLISIFILLLISTEFLAAAESTELKYETRCGWFSNPSPGNISLYDNAGEWIIGVQGGHQIEGHWNWPDFTSHQWMSENGSFGYGCACLEVRADPQSHEVQAIRSARAQPLKSCRKDPALKKREGEVEKYNRPSQSTGDGSKPNF